MHNGHVYKSLADHDPHSTTAINEYDKLYNLDPPWELCPNTPDALHVCKTYPWAAYALVFADGSAHWTALAPSWDSSFKPGAFTITHTWFCVLDNACRNTSCFIRMPATARRPVWK